MYILKTSLKIVFLVLLCVPIVYMEYYIVKNTISDVMNLEKKKSAKSNDTVSNYYGREYLKAVE